MMRDGRTTITVVTVILAFIVIGGYSLFQARKVIAGPVMNVTVPSDGTVVSTTSVNVSGEAKNVAFIYLNDRKIFTDDRGHFDEKVLLFPGNNVIVLRAEDRFGKLTERWINVYKN